jgi:hypothetical protein
MTTNAPAAEQSAAELERELAEARDREHDAEVTQLRRELAAAIRMASRDITGASTAYRELCSPRVYDVEFAEDHGDIRAHLTVAARALRAAGALVQQVEVADLPHGWRSEADRVDHADPSGAGDAEDVGQALAYRSAADQLHDVLYPGRPA